MDYPPRRLSRLRPTLVRCPPPSLVQSPSASPSLPIPSGSETSGLLSTRISQLPGPSHGLLVLVHARVVPLPLPLQNPPPRHPMPKSEGDERGAEFMHALSARFGRAAGCISRRNAMGDEQHKGRSRGSSQRRAIVPAWSPQRSKRCAVCDVGEVEHVDASGAGDRWGAVAATTSTIAKMRRRGSVVGAGEYQTRCWQMQARLLVAGVSQVKVWPLGTLAVKRASRLHLHSPLSTTCYSCAIPIRSLSTPTPRAQVNPLRRDLHDENAVLAYHGHVHLVHDGDDIATATGTETTTNTNTANETTRRPMRSPRGGDGRLARAASTMQGSVAHSDTADMGGTRGAQSREVQDQREARDTAGCRYGKIGSGCGCSQR
ncbi:hypothetical protein D9619_012339 [Psilocybe cf. subviscida]|uniref:Uncharacterized protein n=1 Tax=Psilocybe cf. subviscida TaxID=2480587 RepID=A0A8H5AR95_9AGAR|nr:hypothetical protein D9619_012339 [Psilocybe cf. subviscida]